MTLDELIRWALRLSRPDPVSLETIAERIGVEVEDIEARMVEVAVPVVDVVPNRPANLRRTVGWRERETPDG